MEWKTTIPPHPHYYELKFFVVWGGVVHWKRGPRTAVQLKPTIRRVPADSVPYGRDICTRGNHVWAAYDADRLVCVGATAKKVRELYYRVRLGDSYGRPPMTYPSGLDGRRDRPMSLPQAERIKSDLEEARKRREARLRGMKDVKKRNNRS